MLSHCRDLPERSAGRAQPDPPPGLRRGIQRRRRRPKPQPRRPGVGLGLLRKDVVQHGGVGGQAAPVNGPNSTNPPRGGRVVSECLVPPWGGVLVIFGHFFDPSKKNGRHKMALPMGSVPFSWRTAERKVRCKNGGGRQKQQEFFMDSAAFEARLNFETRPTHSRPKTHTSPKHCRRCCVCARSDAHLLQKKFSGLVGGDPACHEGWQQKTSIGGWPLGVGEDRVRVVACPAEPERPAMAYPYFIPHTMFAGERNVPQKNAKKTEKKKRFPHNDSWYSRTRK